MGIQAWILSTFFIRLMFKKILILAIFAFAGIAGIIIKGSCH